MAPNGIITALSTDERIRGAFRRNGLRQAYLVGSCARGQQRPDSDVDVVYVKRPGTRFTLMNVGDLQSTLEEVLRRRVDLIPSSAVRTELRAGIFQDAKTVYDDQEG